jgi:hypothetical protein
MGFPTSCSWMNCGGAELTHVKNSQDFFAGIIFMGFGIFGLCLGGELTVGTITRMGPGYLPRFLSYALIVMGVFIALKSIRFGNGTIEPPRWRPLVFVLGPILGFAVLIVRCGLVMSIFFVTFASCFGTREARLPGSLVLGAFMATFSVFLFIYCLKLPIQVWPW